MDERLNGFLLVNKPAGVSSFGAVYKVRKIIKELTGQKYKVGHSGTLDPMATGLLILAVGKSTKKLGKLLKKDKVYEVEIQLVYNSTTDDREGELTKISDHKPSDREVKEVISSFQGEISQTPPIYSALKINGQRAYKLARKGLEVEIPPRKVNVYEIQNVFYEYPQVKFTAYVSSGTYIRSLARDIGEKLGTGAYMTSLNRTKIDNLSLHDAYDLDDLSKDNLMSYMISLE